MNEFDRYDFAVSLIVGVIAIGVLALYPHFWIMLATCPITVTIVVLRHLDIDDLFPDEGNRPHRVIVLIRIVNAIQDFGSHLRPDWTRKQRHTT